MNQDLSALTKKQHCHSHLLQAEQSHTSLAAFARENDLDLKAMLERLLMII